jgi:quercetin dioxygenase-like cupin family protein
MTRPPCTSTTLCDDARTRVTRFDFMPGAETGWHRHGLDYVIVTLTDCTMGLEEPGGGRRQVLVPAGSAYRRDAGVEHNVINDGSAAMAFVEVEIKAQAKAAGVLHLTRSPPEPSASP